MTAYQAMEAVQRLHRSTETCRTCGERFRSLMCYYCSGVWGHQQYFPCETLKTVNRVFHDR